jgi:DNA-binding beta-propeller fold protein YncE
MATAIRAFLLLPAFLVACGSDPIETEPTETRSSDDVATAIGKGDGSATSVELFVVYEAAATYLPTALAWNPNTDDELWVTLSRPSAGQCMEADPGSVACDRLWGEMAIVRRATRAAPSTEVKMDANAWHFMRNPRQLAWGTRGLLATCGEARTANYEDDATPYNGPVLWDSDPALFGAPYDPDRNGTHVDMLHETPYCMGIAHEQDNVYWTFNGDAGALDRYDFNEPHAPGGEDHGDGALWRFAEGELLRVPEVPSHLAYDARRKLVFAADTGHGRVVALDATSGTADGDVTTYDPIETHTRMSGATLTEVLAPGELEAPSGLAFHEGVLFVTDHATGRIVALLPNGEILRELDTGLGPNALAGIAIGRDGKAYVTDMATRRVLRIDG